jgi:hypothetical protein
VRDQSFDPAVPGDSEAALLVRNLIESSTEYSIIGNFHAVPEPAPAAMVIVTAEGKDSTSAGGCLPKALRAL